jgi:hypothetical protein
MAKALKSEKITPADEVRILLAESEKMVVSLRGAPEPRTAGEPDRIAAPGLSWKRPMDRP